GLVLRSVMCVHAAALAEDKPLMPEEAARRVGEKVTVAMVVKSASSRSGVCYLNPEDDLKDARNFTVFVGRDALKKFKDAKAEDPAAHLKGKTVRVTGKVSLYRDKPQIAL